MLVTIQCIIFFLNFIYLFVRESTSKAAGRERSRLTSEQGAWCGARFQDPKIMTWAKGGCLTNWATQASLYNYF